MGINVPQLSDYINNDLNILITGPAGTGKTQMLLAAAKSLKLRLKYYSASSLDPFTDLVGVPVPGKDDQGRDILNMIRPRAIDEAEVVFFDEINRADTKTLNALFELIQFKSINGEPLPNLKCIVAAINPNDGNYKGVADLDLALQDRFDMYLESVAEVSMTYFKTKFPEPVARALVQWYREHNKSKTNKNFTYISPRRMETIGTAWMKIRKRSTIEDALPPGGTYDSAKLCLLLEEAVKSTGSLKETVEDVIKSRKEEENNLPAKVFINGVPITKMTPTSVHKNHAEIIKRIKERNLDTTSKAIILKNIALTLRKGVGVDNLLISWNECLKRMSPSDMRIMVNQWSPQKKREFFKKTQNTRYSEIHKVFKEI